MKDLFIDNCIAKNFCNPLDKEYKALIKWLMYPESFYENEMSYLVVSNKILAEYNQTCGSSHSSTNIIAIIGKMQREGRLIKKSNSEIKEFRKKFFRKKILKALSCNIEDRDHIPLVLLSNRKYALSLDENFIKDLTNFPGFLVIAARRPQDIPYL